MARKANRLMGVAGAALCAGLMVATPGTAVAQRPPPSVGYQAHPVEHFVNPTGGEVLYRRGWWYAEQPNNGFGLDKVYHKHGITNNRVVELPVRYPKKMEDAGGGRYVHEGDFVLKECNLSGCTEKDRRTVRVVIDYAPWSIAPERGHLGINTAYCVGDLVCPGWVNSVSPATTRDDQSAPEVVEYSTPDA